MAVEGTNQQIIPGLIDWKKASPIETNAHISDPLKGTPYQSVLSIIKNKITEEGMGKAREAVKKGELTCPRTSYRLRDGEELSGIIPYHVIEKEVGGVKRLFLLYIGSDGLIDNVELKRLEGIEVKEADPGERFAGELLIGFRYLSPKSADGKLENKQRWVKLRGIGFGVAPAHVEVGDVPAYYFVGDDQQYDPVVDKIQGLRRFPDDRIDGLKGNPEERLSSFMKQKISTAT